MKHLHRLLILAVCAVWLLAISTASSASAEPSRLGYSLSFNGQKLNVVLEDPFGEIKSIEIQWVQQVPSSFDKPEVGRVCVFEIQSFASDSSPVTEYSPVQLLFEIPAGWNPDETDVSLITNSTDQEFGENYLQLENKQYISITTDVPSGIYALWDSTTYTAPTSGPSSDSSVPATGDTIGRMLPFLTALMVTSGLALTLPLKKKNRL